METMKNETEIWRSRALAHEENYYQMLKRVDSLTEQLRESQAYADKLVEHKDMICLPKDLEVLREANLGLAMELNEARATCRELVTDSNAITLAQTVVRITQERDELREWASVNGVSSLAKDRDQFRARLREEQQLHVQTLNERDEARETCRELVTDSDAITLARTVVRITQERDQARRERDEWKAKYIQQNKDLGCEMMDPNGTIWDYAKWVQSELTVVKKQLDQLEGKICFELGGHPDSKLWGDAGLIAATMRCVDALDTVTEQRDRLAAALRKLADCDWVITPHDRMDAVREIARKALQSLNQPTKP